MQVPHDSNVDLTRIAPLATPQGMVMHPPPMGAPIPFPGPPPVGIPMALPTSGPGGRMPIVPGQMFPPQGRVSLMQQQQQQQQQQQMARGWF